MIFELTVKHEEQRVIFDKVREEIPGQETSLEKNPKAGTNLVNVTGGKKIYECGEIENCVFVSSHDWLHECTSRMGGQMNFNQSCDLDKTLKSHKSREDIC